MLRHGLFRALATVLLCGLTVHAARQTPPRPQQTPQQPVFRAGVDLVQVDVVVVDQTGNAVRGLHPSDFKLTDRGVTQNVAVFEEVFHEQPAPEDITPPITVKRDVADNRASSSQRLVMLVVDDLHIFQGRTDRAKSLAKELITTLGAGASMALLFTSGEHSTQITDDRALLLAAADTLKGRSAVRRPHEASDTQVARGMDPEMSPEAKLGILQGVGDLRDFEDNMAQYKTMEVAARMIASDSVRRKAFVLLSEGVGKDLTGMFTADISPCELANPKAPCYHDIALEKMMASFRRANVTTYALDPRGKVPSQDLLLENFPSPRGIVTQPGPGAEDSQFRRDNPVRQAQDGLGFVAEASGGFAVTDTDDFEGGLRRIVMDLDHYYLLGFYPSDPKGTKLRPLDVKIAGHPELTLRFRRSYLPGGPPPLPAKADPLISGIMPKTDLPVRIQAIPLPIATDKKRARVAVAIEVAAPTAVLQGSDERLHDDVTFQVAAIDEKQAKVASRTGRGGRVALRPIRNGPAPEMVAYQIQTSVDVPPGRYQIRASLKSVRLGTGGSAYLTIDVPDFNAAPLMLSGIILGHADGPHIPVAPRSPTRPGQPPGPVISLPVAPTLDRDFLRSNKLRVYGVVRANRPSDVRATVSAIDQADHATELATVDLGTIASAPNGVTTNGQSAIDVPIDLAGLEPGAYRIRVAVTDGQASALREIGVVVR